MGRHEYSHRRDMTYGPYHLMNRSGIVFVFAVAALFIFSAAQPVSAISAAQVSGITFQYPQYLNGVYIINGAVVTVGFTLTNIGTEWTTFHVCVLQRVGFGSGGYGDNYQIGCAITSLPAACLTGISWCTTSSRTLTIPGSVYASAPGQLLIRVVVYDTRTSANVPITTSPWYPVTYIVP